ncbi:hypothetical protein BH23GEM9_BH23GEM9_25200 [soil metagenome]
MSGRSVRSCCNAPGISNELVTSRAMPKLRLVQAALLLWVLAGTSGEAQGQLPADAVWRTLESSHFRVTFEPGLEHLATRAAATAERAHAALSTLVAAAPRGVIDIVIADNVDFSNGYATPFPANRVVIYAKPPVDVLELQYMSDWIDLVVIHELAHIFHLDVTSGFGRVLRAVFGRVPLPWPLFPAAFTPTWSIEGLAVGIESALTDFGRVHGSYHEMVVRTAALAGELDDIDRLTSATPTWPGPTRVYIYGSLFMDYLAREYGPDVTARIVQATADALIPPPLWFGRVGQRVLGVSFRHAYEAWQQQLKVQYAELAATLTAQGLTTGVPMTTHRAFALYPRFSPDGAAIAYAANDRRGTPRTRVIDSATGYELWSRRRNDLAAVSWLDDAAVITSDLDYVDRFRIFSDLYTVDRSGARRLTRSARLQDVDVTAGGTRAVAVENGIGTNRLVLMDTGSGAIRPINGFDPAVHWALPRFSPDGARLAVGRWRAGGFYDVVVMDTLGRTLIQVTDEPGVSAAPAWSPDGHWLLFWSDRSGIPNLYAAEIGQMGGDAAGGVVMTAPLRPRLRQVTSVLTGAFFPDVSPDGSAIVYAAYHQDGFRIERMAFDTASWRAPMPARHGDIATGRGEHVHATATTPLMNSVRAAAAAADTTWTEPERYRPLRYLRPYGWMPAIDAGSRVGDFFGVWTYGSDLVGRHDWEAGVSFAPRNSRVQGVAGYTYRGLPAGFVHPTLSAAVDRTWDNVLNDVANERFIDQEEDRVAAGVTLTSLRWRASSSMSVAGEIVRRRRILEGITPAEVAYHLLNDPDVLRGVRASTFFARYVRPPFAISPENGVSVRLTGRRRWDTDPRQVTTTQGIIDRNLSYREATTSNAGYVALPLPGFARHVLAARVSALYRDGPGGGLSGVGGAGMEGFTVGDLLTNFGGTSHLLPIRGFPENTRIGNRAWTASAEYRLPLAMINRSLRPLPAFADRLSAAVFADTGHAWCDDEAVRRLGSLCEDSDRAAPPLLAAGAELTAFLSFYGIPVPVRFGAGYPLQGDSAPRLRGYVMTGFAF